MTRPTAMPSDDKPALTPKLRFPEFRSAPDWAPKPLEACLDYEQPTPYLVSDTNYSDSFKTPVLTAGKTFILGYTNEQDGIFEEGLPVIIFDDFTTATQFVDFPFKAKSSAMKILRARDGANIKFMYERLRTLSFEVGAHERHWISTFAPMLVSVPQPAEQQKIAECLSTLDELIGAESQKLDALKAHKKGLMQQLFPREGETLPRLRFPEFHSAPEWEDDKLGAVCELYQPVTLSASELSMTGEYLVYGANGVIGSHNEYNHEESEVAVTCRGATCGEVNRTQPKSWITGNAMVVKPRDERLSRDFIFHYFKNHGLKSVISGSAQPQITRTGFAPLSVSFPKPAEQHRIATCLSSLDDLIAAQSDRLAALRTHKQGLLQQLFPSPAEGAT